MTMGRREGGEFHGLMERRRRRVLECYDTCLVPLAPLIAGPTPIGSGTLQKALPLSLLYPRPRPHPYFFLIAHPPLLLCTNSGQELSSFLAMT